MYPIFNLLNLASLQEQLFSAEKALSIVPASLVSFLCSVCAILVIYFATKYRNGEHKPLYYVFALFFPLITLIVFAIKRKEMNGVGMKVCPSCHRKYPREFVTCYQCNIELPPYNERKKQIEKVCAIVLSVVFALSCVLSSIKTVVSVADFMITAVTDILGDDSYSSYFRQGFKDENGNTCYYDMKGKVYSDPDDVALYTKDGAKYVYSNAADAYLGTDGGRVEYFYAFVDKDGYLVEVDFEDLYSGPSGYIDEDGNKYYEAPIASWDKDGNLIIK